MAEGAIERTALTAQVYDRVLEGIVDGQYPPGQRLNIDQLARDLRVSITPVREALARLSSQHLVQFEPYKGYSVLPAMDATRLDQLFDVRILVEVSAVPAGIAHVNSTQLAVLREIIAAMRLLTPGEHYREFRAFNDHDQAFHRKLIALSGNDFLIDMYDTLSPHIHIGRFYHERGVLDTQRIIEEHTAIVEAYERRDTEAAGVSVRRHLLAARNRLNAVLPERSAESTSRTSNEKRVTTTTLA